MEKQQRKIVHLHLKETNIDDYFGSITAIYDYYTKEDIGYTLRTLQAFNISEEKPFENDKICIKIARLKQKVRK